MNIPATVGPEQWVTLIKARAFRSCKQYCWKRPLLTNSDYFNSANTILSHHKAEEFEEIVILELWIQEAVFDKSTRDDSASEHKALSNKNGSNPISHMHMSYEAVWHFFAAFNFSSWCAYLLGWCIETNLVIWPKQNPSKPHALSTLTYTFDDEREITDFCRFSRANRIRACQGSKSALILLRCR